MAASGAVQRMGLDAARRTALAAQGFGDPRPAGPITRRQLLRVVDRIRLLQLDSVTVLTRAHYLPVFSRLGPYPRGLLDEAAWEHPVVRHRPLVEYWAHEASLVPVLDWPLLRSGAKKPGWWNRYGELATRSPELVSAVLDVVTEADRIAGALRVPGAYAEPGIVGTPQLVAELARALREMADWLELDGIASGERGDLVAALGAVTRQRLGGQRVRTVPR